MVLSKLPNYLTAVLLICITLKLDSIQFKFPKVGNQTKSSTTTKSKQYQINSTKNQCD